MQYIHAHSQGLVYNIYMYIRMVCHNVRKTIFGRSFVSMIHRRAKCLEEFLKMFGRVFFVYNVCIYIHLVFVCNTYIYIWKVYTNSLKRIFGNKVCWQLRLQEGLLATETPTKIRVLWHTHTHTRTHTHTHTHILKKLHVE